VLAIETDGQVIQTIEGLSDGITLSPLQQAFVDHQAFPCGYCTPGFIMAAKALLDENPNPTFDEAREAVSGHLCICGNYQPVIEVIMG
jgi:aerobic-type carbon monoxide dehydrogenase small subunit (CoxS/CutS family)